jgi:hypothetical protein
MSEKIKFNQEESVVKDLQFEPNPNTHNLVICGLVSVTYSERKVEEVDANNNPNTSEYAGKTLPSLELVFKSFPAANTNERVRVLRVIEQMPYTIKKDGSPIAKKTVDDNVYNMYGRLKHIYDAYAAEPNFAPLAKLPEIDMEASIEKRIDQFSKFFKVFADCFNKGKDGVKPTYLQVNNLPVKMWLKVLPDWGTKAWYTIPGFVKDGFIERLVMDGVRKVPFTPNIKVKPSETLELKPTKRGKSEGGASNDSPEETTEDVTDLLSKLKG